MKDTQTRQTLGEKDELIRQLREENKEWKAKPPPQSAPDLQLRSCSSGPSYSTLDQLTASVLSGVWPNLYGYPAATQSGYPTAAKRNGYGAHQPGPGIGMLPPIPVVPTPPLPSTGILPSLLHIGSNPRFVLQSTVPPSVPMVPQPVQTSPQTARSTQSGPTLPGPT